MKMRLWRPGLELWAWIIVFIVLIAWGIWSATTPLAV